MGSLTRSAHQTPRGRAPADVVAEMLVTSARGRVRSLLERYEQRPLIQGLRHLGPSLIPGARVLDIGCGSGWLIDGLAQAGVAAVGIDVDMHRLRNGLSGPRGHSTHAARLAADAVQLPFEDDSFDAVMSVSVLQYTNWPLALQECRRVLKVGGRGLFIETLFGHPLARLYRATRRAAWPYPRNLKPKQHIRWSDLDVFGEIFGSATAQAHALFTPALAASGAFSRSDARFDSTNQAANPGRGMSCFTRTAFDFIEALDATLLERWRGAGQYAWMATVTCTK